MLVAASALIVIVAIAHSYLGERYILTRLFRQPLPVLLGSDAFTRQTLRFAWHATSVLGVGIAGLLTLVHTNQLTEDNLLFVIGATFVVTAGFPLVATRGRHLSWIVFLAVAGLCFASALGS